MKMPDPPVAIGPALDEGTRRLADAGIPSARLDAELLLVVVGALLVVAVILAAGAGKKAAEAIHHDIQSEAT